MSVAITVRPLARKRGGPAGADDAGADDGDAA
jgi:hypothetical protein